MAKRRVNKSAKIREAIATLGADVKPAAVVEALAAKKIKVTAQAVSQIKGKGKPKRKPKSDQLSLDSLLIAKKLVDAVGIVKAKQAIEALAKLR